VGVTRSFQFVICREVFKVLEALLKVYSALSSYFVKTEQGEEHELS
jgi:hypothetical protein